MKIGKFYFDWMDLLIASLACALIAAFAGLFMALNANVDMNRRLIQQCMDDGRKEYECRAMIFNKE